MVVCEDITPPSPPTPLQSVSGFHVTQRRNPEDVCFGCKRKGHWAQECPNKVPKNSPFSTPAESSPSSSKIASFPAISCPCGNGTCSIMTSHSKDNPGRKFYACPAQNFSEKGGFFMWCDEVVKFGAPMCACGAGICSLNGEMNAPNANSRRWYFSCRIKKNHGACPFFQWADSQVNVIMNRHKCRSKGNSSFQPSCTSHQVLSSTNDDLGEKEGSTFEMQFESTVVESSDMEFKSPLMESPETPLSLSIVNLQEAESWQPKARKALRFSQTMSQAETQHHQREFWTHIHAAGDSLSQGVFPSSDPVDIPEYEFVDMSNIEGSNALPLSSSNVAADVPPPQTPKKDTQNLSGIEEHLGLKTISSAIQGDAVSGLILKKLGQALVGILENMMPLDYKRMLEVAETTFCALHNLTVNYQPLNDSVKQYINFASKAVEIEEAMRKDVSSRELVDRYNHKKAQFEENLRLRDTKLAEYKASDHCCQALRRQVSHVKDTLLQLERELSLCEVQTSELQTCVRMIFKDVSKSKQSMDAACMEMEEALALDFERESMLDAAKTALETARSQLQ